MGFMAGFGSAFQRSFENTSARIDAKRDDDFKIKFNEYKQRKTKMDATRAEESKAQRQAEQLAAGMKDPAAAGFIYQQIMDFGLKSVEDKLADGRLSKIEGYTPKEEAKSAGSELVESMEKAQPAKGSMFISEDDRLARRLDDVTGGEYSNPTPQDSPYQGQDTGGYTLDIPEPQAPKLAAHRDLLHQKAVAEQNGNAAKVKELNMKIAASSEAAMEDAMLSARARGNTDLKRFVIPGPDGQATYSSGLISADENGDPIVVLGPGTEPVPLNEVIELDENHSSAKSRVVDKAAPIIQAYNAKQAAVLEGMEVSARAMEIVNWNPEVLKAGARWASGINDAVANVDSVSTMIRNQFNIQAKDPDARMSKEDMAEVERMEAGLISLVDDSTLNLGEQYKVYQAYMSLAAYKFARMEGQDGRAASDMDIQRFLDITGQSSFENSYKDTLRGVLNTYINGLRGERALITSGANIPQVEQFEKEYGYSLGLKTSSTEELANADGSSEYIKASWEFMQEPNSISQQIEKDKEPKEETKPAKLKEASNANITKFKQLKESGVHSEKVLKREWEAQHGKGSFERDKDLLGY